MLRVALTGGIATGKSYVLDRIRRHGIPCLDADELAHGVTVAGTEATAAIVERFGDVLATDGSVDRHKLGPSVFADAAARRDLEAIVHPAVFRAIAAGLRGFERIGDSPLAVVDIPLLYETGHADRDRRPHSGSPRNCRRRRRPLVPTTPFGRTAASTTRMRA